jgi:hypothetical protein
MGAHKIIIRRIWYLFCFAFLKVNRWPHFALLLQGTNRRRYLYFSQSAQTVSGAHAACHLVGT